jgi:hypothetical protein
MRLNSPAASEAPAQLNTVEPSRSHTGRFFRTFADYDWKDPAEIGAAAVHAVTQLGGLDPVFRDILRFASGEKGTIEPLRGGMARIREDLGDVFKRKGLAKIGGILNIVGDTFADGADALAGKYR